jgi:hypothetical protein
MPIAEAYTTAPDPHTLFAAADEKYEGLKVVLCDAETLDMSHDQVEHLIEEQGREVLRELLQSHLDLRSFSEVVEPVVGADGQERTHRRDDEERTLTTILGDVRVGRTRYEGRGMGSVCPLDGDLNLPPEQYSLEVRRQAAKNAARGPYEATVETLSERAGETIPKRQVEELIQRAAADFDAFYQQTILDLPAAQTAPLLVLTFDGKGIVMRPEGLREATRKAAAKAKPKLKSRLTKGEKKNRKRMAEVAAVYTVAPYQRTPEEVVAALWRDEDGRADKRPRPEYKRVWASVTDEPIDVIDAAFAEASSRDPLRQKTWVVAVDGDPHQLRYIRKVAKRYKVKVIIILDVIHVLEYLWKASYVFHKEGSPEAEQWVRERLRRVLLGEAGQVAGGIRRSATKRGIGAKARKPADSCARYLSKYKQYLRYDVMLSLGSPIGTGVAEGACRHLIRDRMELTGCRWGLEGAEAILRLRSLISSGDFDEYWQFHREQELRRNHLERYEGKRLPEMAKPRPGSRLRVVK